MLVVRKHFIVQKSSRSNILLAETTRGLGALLSQRIKAMVSAPYSVSTYDVLLIEALTAVAKGGRPGESAYFVGVSQYACGKSKSFLGPAANWMK